MTLSSKDVPMVNKLKCDYMLMFILSKSKCYMGMI